jgi:ubiquinone/menaquinone biosynthesis C-methylase UbiE
MIKVAKSRLAAYETRAQVALSDGTIQFPCSDHSVERVVSTYVLDLLSEADIQRFFGEAHRVLVPGGELCLASLTRGVNLPSRIVSSLWMNVFRLKPAIVGGCRPIRLDAFADDEAWRVKHQKVVTPFGVPSEVLILAAREVPR